MYGSMMTSVNLSTSMSMLSECCTPLTMPRSLSRTVSCNSWVTTRSAIHRPTHAITSVTHSPTYAIKSVTHSPTYVVMLITSCITSITHFLNTCNHITYFPAHQLHTFCSSWVTNPSTYRCHHITCTHSHELHTLVDDMPTTDIHII